MIFIFLESLFAYWCASQSGTLPDSHLLTWALIDGGFRYTTLLVHSGLGLDFDHFAGIAQLPAAPAIDAAPCSA